MADFDFDVCVVGTGRVGLPLALALIETGFCVTGVDIDAGVRQQVNAGEMPFHEPGFETVVASRRLHVTDHYEVPVPRAACLPAQYRGPRYNAIRESVAGYAH